MNSNEINCLICSSKCGSDKGSYNIFSKDSEFQNDLSIPAVLSRLLESEIKKETVISQILCGKCYKLVDEYDELLCRVSQIKAELTESFNSTISESNTIIENAKIRLEDSESVEEMAVSEIEPQNMVPKKILDIPSSDEESAQAALDKDQLQIQTLEDIEMELVKIHGEDPDNSQLDMDANSHHSFHNFVEHSDSDEMELQVGSNGFIQKNNLINIKVEPGTDDTITISTTTTTTTSNATVLTSSGHNDLNKPNILKKRGPPLRPNNYITNVRGHIENVRQIDDELAGTPIVARDGDLYTCLMCVGDETVAGEAKAIIAHVRESHDARLYICDVCGKDFRKRNLLSAHLDDHVAAEDGDFQCEVCNRIFTNLRLFRIHRRMHHPQNKAWTCETCGKRYSSKNLLDEHVNTHLGVRPYVCATCGKDFASKYTFKAHEKIHETRPRPFSCSVCPKSFLSQQNLTQHEKTHTGLKDFTCHLCNKQFSSAHNLEVHSIVHTGFKPFVCGLCGKAFARKAEIRDHERTHTGERPYQCEFCGATFSQRSNLQSHKRATHYDDKRYICPDCGKRFKRRRLLDYHVKAVHTGERPFKCDTCDATFVYPEHFKKHRRIHTGEKPFLCEVCCKAFNSRDNRNAHRFVHSDKKPYECLVCAAGFMRKPLLYQHMQQQGHLNDTIVVNQPRLTTEDDQLVTVNYDGDMELIETSGDSKLYIQGDDGAEHIIIDGQQITFAEATSDDDERDDEVEGVEEVEHVIAEGSDEEEYEEIITSDALASGETQIIDTPDGPVQLVKVRIPNENGEEEEAWIKIVPE